MFPDKYSFVSGFRLFIEVSWFSKCSITIHMSNQYYLIASLLSVKDHLLPDLLSIGDEIALL